MIRKHRLLVILMSCGIFFSIISDEFSNSVDLALNFSQYDYSQNNDSILSAHLSEGLTKEYSLAWNHYVSCAKYDNNNNLYIAGMANNLTESPFGFLMKIRPDLSVQWIQNLSDPQYLYTIKAFTFDSEGDLVCVGSQYKAPYISIFLVKYTPIGHQVWNRTYRQGYGQIANDVIINPMGNIVIGGCTLNETYAEAIFIGNYNSTGDSLCNYTSPYYSSINRISKTYWGDGGILFAGETNYPNRPTADVKLIIPLIYTEFISIYDEFVFTTDDVDESIVDIEFQEWQGFYIACNEMDLTGITTVRVDRYESFSQVEQSWYPFNSTDSISCVGIELHDPTYGFEIAGTITKANGDTQGILGVIHTYAKPENYTFFFESTNHTQILAFTSIYRLTSTLIGLSSDTGGMPRTIFLKNYQFPSFDLINYPPDMVIQHLEPDKYIMWEINSSRWTDQGNYTVNYGDLFSIDGNWTSEIPIPIGVSLLPVGVWDVTIIVEIEGLGEFNNTVQVTVLNNNPQILVSPGNQTFEVNHPFNLTWILKDQDMTPGAVYSVTINDTIIYLFDIPWTSQVPIVVVPPDLPIGWHKFEIFGTDGYYGGEFSDIVLIGISDAQGNVPDKVDGFPLVGLYPLMVVAVGLLIIREQIIKKKKRGKNLIFKEKY